MKRRAIFTPQRYSPHENRTNAWMKFLCDGTDQSDLIVKEIDKTIGKGVFAGRKFPAGSFLVEYSGELITEKEGVKRERSYPVKYGSFLLYFKNGRSLMCIDATFSTQCGRYVNDGRGEEKNAELKVAYVGKTPHVVLLACRNIAKDEEIRFDYGVANLPWRQKHKPSGVHNRDSLCHSIKECKVLLQKMDPGADTCVYNKEDGTEVEVKISRTTHTELEYQTAPSTDMNHMSTTCCANEIRDTNDGLLSVIANQRRPNTYFNTPDVVEMDLNTKRDSFLNFAEDTMVEGHHTETFPIKVYRSQETLSQNTEHQQNRDKNGKTILATKGQSSKVISLVAQDQADNTGPRTRSHLDKENEEDDTNARNASLKKTLCQNTEHQQKIDRNNKGILAFEGKSAQVIPSVAQDQTDNTVPKTRAQLDNENQETVTNARNTSSKSARSQNTEGQQNGDKNGKRILNMGGLTSHVISSVAQADNTGPKTRAQLDEENEEDDTNARNASLKRQTSGIKAADANTNEDELVVHCIIIDDQDATTSTNTGGGVEIPLSNNEREEEDTDQQRCVEDDPTDHEKLTVSTTPPTNGKPKSPTTTDHQSKTKPHRPCPYCFCYKSALTKHLVKKHGDKTEVIDALKLQKQDRDRAFLLLKRKGIMLANMDKLRSEGNKTQSLIRERKRSSESKNVIYCSKCFGFFKKTYFYRHRRDCHLNERSMYFPHAVQPDIVAMEAIHEEKFSKEILGSLYNDDVGQICKNDLLIVSYAQKKFRKLLTKKNTEKYEDKKVNIRTEMRRLGNLFKVFKQLCADNKLPCASSFELYNPERFYILEEAIEIVTIKEDGCVKYGLRKDIGYLIKRICKFLHGKFSVEQNIENRNQVDSFLNVLTFFWSDIFGEAESALVFARQTQLRKPAKLPQQSDVKKLKDFMRSEIQQLTESDYNFIASSDFIRLRNLVVSRLTLFNARRGGEPCCLQTNQWAEAESNVWLGESNIDQDPVEQSLLGKYKIAYQTGKGEKLVPLLILDDCWKALEKLCDPEVRRQANVEQKNTFVFPRIQYSLKHVSGWEAVKECCNLAGLDHAINATGMRHYIATIYAGLEMKESERETFYNHMGHSESVNKNVYQSPPARQTITKVGRFLQSIDQDTLSNATGKRQKGDGSVKNAMTLEGQSPQEQDDDTATGTSQANDTVINSHNASPMRKKIRSTKEGRSYKLWSVEGTNLIRDYFNDYILSLQHLDTNRGSLPGVDKINTFLDQCPNILQNLSRKERISRVRTKVFNERKLAREKVRREVNKDMLESKFKHTTTKQ